MPQRTQLFQQFPWVGGLNTSQDESLIAPNQLTRADNVIFNSRGSRQKRDGFRYNWDNGTSGSDSIYGLHEFWFGTTNKTQIFVAINDAASIFKVTSGGLKTALTILGQTWTAPTNEPSFTTFNNRCIMAINGMTNFMKKWDGVATSVEDLRNIFDHTLASNGRSSSGTTRTLILSTTFKGLVGDYVIIANSTSDYNGTWQVTNVSTTNVSSDTIQFTAATPLTESPTTDASMTINGLAPNASLVRDHLGRLWCNDKNNKDRIHYSGSFNHEQWLGFGDSGALDIGIGDGDPEGITAIFPTFKGELFVAKRTKLYRISGYSPETFSISLISSGIGCVSHNSICLIDQDDMFFVSEKGVHSVAATSNFGDFNSSFVSADIQKTFIERFSRSRLKFVKSAYNPEINSVAFCFTDSSVVNPTNTNFNVNNAVWFYNIPYKAWYRWPDVPCQSLISATDGDKKRLYFGTHTNRIIKSSTNNTYDIDYNGDFTPIEFTVVTGQLSIDGSLYTEKGFKRFILYYKPEGTHAHEVSVRIDNIPVDEVNNFTFSEAALGVLLGVDFVLGESPLGSTARLSGYTRSIDGYGKSCKVSIVNSGLNDVLEIPGFGIEWEPAGTSPEVNTGE